MKKPFSWDPFSDQPYQLKDRTFKKAMRRRQLGSLVRTVLVSLIMLPMAILSMLFVHKRAIESEHFFGMSINLDKEPELTPELIEELDVDALLVRFPLWEMDQIGRYREFLAHFQDKKLLINVMQDREHIEDPELFKEHLMILFKEFTPYADTFQIGTTINRAKWGFFSVDEYLRFFEVALRLKQAHYPQLQLIGPSVIDFEYHFTAHALFNLSPVRYDAQSALLYVDRRGAPENGQMGFDLLRKIRLMASLAMLSPKAGKRLYLTEANWPITGTAPYAPTSEYECVDEEAYADFMVRYYLLAFASSQVDAVYWHQLIAPGYGLIDNRHNLNKRTAFNAFKTMVSHLKHSKLLDFKHTDTHYELNCQNTQNGEHFSVCWALEPFERTFSKAVRIITRDGDERQSNTLAIGTSVHYIYADEGNA